MKALGNTSRCLCAVALFLSVITGWMPLANAADYAILVTSVGSAIEGVATNVVTVTLDQAVAAGESVSVDWQTVNGDAVAPGDFAAGSGTLVFAPGESVKTISITPLLDNVVEGNETFDINLTQATRTGAGLLTGALATGNVTETITIVNDDTASLTVESKSVAESSGTVSYTVTSDKTIAANATVTFDYTTANGTATAGSDYTVTAGPGTITNGTTTTIRRADHRRYGGGT